MGSYDFCNFRLKDTVSHSISVVAWGQVLGTQLTSHKLQVHQILISKDYVLWLPFIQQCGELMILDLEFKYLSTKQVAYSARLSQIIESRIYRNTKVRKDL